MSIYDDPLEQMLAKEGAENEAFRLRSEHNAGTHCTAPHGSHDDSTYEFVSSFMDDNRNYSSFD